MRRVRSTLAVVRRDGRAQTVTLQLSDGWRRRGDLSWRVTSWGLRRIATGGLLLETLPEEARSAVEFGMASPAPVVGEILEDVYADDGGPAGRGRFVF